MTVCNHLISYAAEHGKYSALRANPSLKLHSAASGNYGQEDNLWFDPAIFRLKSQVSYCIIIIRYHKRIYPIVPHTPAFLHGFQLLVTVVKGIALKRHLYFYSLVLEFLFCYCIPYPIVPHTPAFLHSSLLLVIVVRSFIFLLIGTGIVLVLFYILSDSTSCTRMFT